MMSAAAVVEHELASFEHPWRDVEAPSTKLMSGCRVLCIGQLAPSRLAELREAGISVSMVSTVDEGLVLMVESRFDAVIVEPNIERLGDGVRLVTSVKEATLCSDAVINVLKWSYTGIPFVLLPTFGSTSFAIFWSSVDFRLADLEQTSLAEAVLEAIHPPLN